MRKKTINHLFDSFMWYVVYLTPLLIWLGISIRIGKFSTLSSAFDLIGMNIFTDNVILSSLSNIFGIGGVFPLFASNDVLIYFTYFVSVYLIHLVVDFLLFIPRLCHKWLNSFCRGEE